MSTQYLGDVSKTNAPPVADEQQRKHRDQKEVVYGPPKNEFEALALLCRADGALALTLPAIFGGVLAWWELGHFNIVLFIFACASMFCVVAGMNILSDYQDYWNRKAPEAKYILTEPYHAGSNLLVEGLFPHNKALRYASVLMGVGLASIIGLALFRGWPVLFFMALSLFLLCAFLTPPKLRGYLRWGLGEIGIFFGAGLLPLFYGFYAQTGTLTSQALWLSIPIGLLSVSVMFAYSFVHQRTDWVFGRRTLVVTLGERRSINLETLLVLLAFMMLLMIAIYTQMTPWVLFGLLGLPIAMGQLKRIHSASMLTPNARFHLYRAIVKTTLVTGTFLILALWLDKMF